MSRSVGVIDFGAGNLFSVERGLRAAGSDAAFITNPENVSACGAILLPGVGAFGAGMAKMRANGMDRAVIEFAATGKPILGVCLGMQFLMSRSLEFGNHDGLGLIPGAVERIPIRLGIPPVTRHWLNLCSF